MLLLQDMVHTVFVVVVFFAASGSVLLLVLQDLVKLAADSMAKVQEYVDLINVNRELRTLFSLHAHSQLFCAGALK